MTTGEYKAHFSLWSILASPLMAGNDLRTMTPEIKEILTNKDVIAVNQDTLGLQGYKFIDFGDLEVWVKPLAGGEAAFCFLNRSNVPANLDYDWKKHGMYHESIAKSKFNIKANEYDVIDLWTKKNLGTTNRNIKTIIAGHEVLMVRLKAKSR
jgi:alpha-galactosidase